MCIQDSTEAKPAASGYHQAPQEMVVIFIFYTKKIQVVFFFHDWFLSWVMTSSFSIVMASWLYIILPIQPLVNRYCQLYIYIYNISNFNTLVMYFCFFFYVKGCVFWLGKTPHNRTHYYYYKYIRTIMSTLSEHIHDFLSHKKEHGIFRCHQYIKTGLAWDLKKAYIYMACSRHLSGFHVLFCRRKMTTFDKIHADW